MKRRERYVHPFPARMASEVVSRRLRHSLPGAKLLDPMVGSGTTVVAGRQHGLETYGIDRDPLAVLIADASTADLSVESFYRDALAVAKLATKLATKLDARSDFPEHCDLESRRFLRYWFDAQSRRELLAILKAIRILRPESELFLKVAFSRMIIAKRSGVSLAEDIPHSRPHRTRTIAPKHPLQAFPLAVRTIANVAQFLERSGLPRCTIANGDCRDLSRFSSGFFDYVITSPPYLNAIDYLRAHKMALVWLGMSIDEIRRVRSSNIGTECGSDELTWDWVVEKMVRKPELLSGRFRRVVRQYAKDIYLAVNEIARVTRPGGCIVLVIGDCNSHGIDIFNSKGISAVARRIGLSNTSTYVRELRRDRRYLPPPKVREGGPITKRMWKEVVLTYKA